MRKPFDFKMIDVPAGAILTFKDQEDVICKVTDQIPARVCYKGEVVSLSKAAQKAGGLDYQVRGPLYWKYEGELLTERRKRIEEEEKGMDKLELLGVEYDVMETGLESPDSEGEASQKQVHGTDEEYVQLALAELERLVPVLYRLETERLPVRQWVIKYYCRCIDVLPERLQRQVEILLRL